MGASYRLNLDIPDNTRRHTITCERRRVEKALCGLSCRTACASLHGLGFVEVMATPVRPTPPAGTEIELQRPDGTRLRIHTYEQQLPVATLVRTFLETPGCSS